MSRICLLLLAFFCAGALCSADDQNVVFRSDVALMRVDAQVVDRDNRAITGLRADDFVLREEGRVQQIRNFASEDMPLDILFLLDVSASMRPHVQRIADAAHQALTVLGDNDRVGIMVFDRYTRLRMPFRHGRANVERELDNVLRQEGFRGGTDITRGMYDAAAYVGREGRKDARRAIVILTDDETQMDRDDEGVLRALDRADAVMSALIAPDAMGTHGGYGRGGGYPGGGGGWPGSGPTIGAGPVIWGRRGGYGRPGGGYGMSTHSAGTAEIARRSGGDSMPVTGASALEDTLERLRQRYALHFYLPPDVKGGQQRHLDVQLSSAALARYPDAEVRFRRTYYVPDGVTPAPAAAAGAGNADPVVVTRAGSNGTAEPATPMAEGGGSGLKRRRAVNEDGSAVDGEPKAAAETVTRAPDSAPAQPPVRGWRRVSEPTSTPGPLDKPADDKKTDDKKTGDTTTDPPKTGWPKAQ